MANLDTAGTHFQDRSKRHSCSANSTVALFIFALFGQNRRTVSSPQPGFMVINKPRPATVRSQHELWTRAPSPGHDHIDGERTSFHFKMPSHSPGKIDVVTRQWRPDEHTGRPNKLLSDDRRPHPSRRTGWARVTIGKPSVWSWCVLAAAATPGSAGGHRLGIGTLLRAWQWRVACVDGSWFPVWLNWPRPRRLVPVPGLGGIDYGYLTGRAGLAGGALGK